MSYFDKRHSGRCFSFTPTPEMISFGIKFVIVRMWEKSKLYFGTRGFFKTAEDLSQILIGESRSIYIDLDHEVNHELNSEGRPCNNEPEYDKDLCTDAELESKSLETFGCTTPFGANKDKICQDQVIGSKALKLYKDTFMNKRATNCNSPCSFVSTKAMKTREIYGDGFVKMFLKENIQVIEAYHLYSGLSFIAEVGGYVGLFLGVSVNQISTMVNAVLDKLEWILNRNKRFF